MKLQLPRKGGREKEEEGEEGGSYMDPAHYNGGRNAQKYDVFAFRCTTTEVLVHMLCSWAVSINGHDSVGYLALFLWGHRHAVL